MEAAVAPVRGRVVGQHVVGAVLPHDAVVGARVVVPVHHREAARLVREDAQAVLGDAQLVHEGAVADAQGGVVGVAPDLDLLVAEGREAPRIDAVDAHVRARGGRDDLPGLVADARGLRAVEHVVDVVVDPLAHEEDGLAPPAHAGEPLRDLPQGVQGRARLVGPFRVLGIGGGAAPRPGALHPVVLVRLVEGGGAEPAARGAVHRGQEQPLVAGELLRALRGPRGVDDGHEVVGPQLLLDELPGRLLHAAGAREEGVFVVDDHDVDAAVEGTDVASDVGLHGLLRPQGLLRGLHGDVHHGEGAHGLGLAVLEDLELVGPEVAHGVAVLVRDEDVHLDVADLALEDGDARGGRGRLGKGERGKEARRDEGDRGPARREAHRV